MVSASIAIVNSRFYIPQCVVLAPAFEPVLTARTNHGDAVGARYLGGVVRRAIVDDDDLGRRNRLIAQADDGVGDACRFVIRGNQDGNAGLHLRHNVRHLGWKNN